MLLCTLEGPQLLTDYSMRVIDLIQPLLLDSKLFEDPANPRLPSIKGDGPGRRASKKAGTSLKIGQGGTLDPLADGVLGKLSVYSESNAHNQ